MGCKAWRNGEYKKSEVIIKDNARKEKLLRNRFIKVYNGSVCVVAIHTQPLYSIQSIVVQRLFDTITSLAVPYFFSVSGFLLFSKIDANILSRKSMEVCKKYLSRVLSLYVIWNIIYLPITIFGFKENNMSFARYVLDCIRGFLFIGQQFYSWQLWYLLSVFFVIASICIMAEHKIKDKNIFKIMMAIFLMGGYRSTNDS